MTHHQQTLTIALEQLRRTPWPKGPVTIADPDLTPAPTDTTITTLPPPAPDSTIQIDALDADAVRHALSQRLVSADRWTSRFTPNQLADHCNDRRPMILHAIDADPAVPLLAYWAVQHRALLGAIVRLLKTDLKIDLHLALPSDLPTAWRRECKSVLPVKWIDAKYPAGHWRMLPHVMGLQKSKPLVLDAVAAIDLAFASALKQPPPRRPIAVCDLARDRPLRFALVPRGRTLAELGPTPAPYTIEPDTQWIAGPRWRRRRAADTFPIGDGELVFHAVPIGSGKQSPCVRCGWCEYICPTRCDPVGLMNVLREFDPRRAERAGLSSCIDCGLCTNVCPSNLPLHEFIDQLRHVSREAP